MQIGIKLGVVHQHDVTKQNSEIDCVKYGAAHLTIVPILRNMCISLTRAVI